MEELDKEPEVKVVEKIIEVPVEVEKIVEKEVIKEVPVDKDIYNDPVVAEALKHAARAQRG